jgi:type I restriction enzyme S subunit
MSIASYKDVKSTGIGWLEDVPNVWSLVPLKKLSDFVNGSAFKPVDWKESGVPIIRIENLNGSEQFNFSQEEIDSRYHVQYGDLLFGWSGNRGTSFGPFVWSRTGLHYLNQHIFKITNLRCDQRWYYWCLKAVTAHVEQQAHGIIGMVHVTKGELGGIKAPVPSVSEQQSIANFLDRETAKLDALIEEQKRLIELLKEKRQSVISHAVTKGLDPSAPMKDSGVEWLGQVPAHWEVRAIKRLSPVMRGASPRPIDDPKYFDDEGEYSWVRIADVSACGGLLYETDQKLSLLGSSLSVCLESGSLFVSIAGSVGKPCITAVKVCIHDGFVYFPQLSIPSSFLFRIFEAGLCYGGLGKMGTQLNLNTDTIGSIFVALPPPAEIITIIDFLNSKTAQFDSLIQEVSAAIALLQERRAALISAAVTGKIDLRGLVAADAEAAQ